MKHLFKSNLKNHIKNIQNEISEVEWETTGCVNHLCQYPFYPNHKWKYTDTISYVISGYTNETRNLVQLIINEDEIDNSELYLDDYQIEYYFGRFYECISFQERFKNIDDVKLFIQNKEIEYIKKEKRNEKRIERSIKKLKK